jgi:hypothetical protein
MSSKAKAAGTKAKAAPKAPAAPVEEVKAEVKAAGSKAKAAPKASAAPLEEVKAEVKFEKADAAIMGEIDAAFAAAGKDAAADKEKAIARMAACAASTPFVLPRVDKLIPLFDNSKMAAPAQKAARAIVENAQPKGHGVAAVVVPMVLAGMQDKKWKVKAGCIELLIPCLKQMENTPAQLAQCLPMIVPRLAEAALEVRAEIRNATAAVLREIGNLVASPEIKKTFAGLGNSLGRAHESETHTRCAGKNGKPNLPFVDRPSITFASHACSSARSQRTRQHE